MLACVGISAGLLNVKVLVLVFCEVVLCVLMGLSVVTVVMCRGLLRSQYVLGNRVCVVCLGCFLSGLVVLVKYPFVVHVALGLLILLFVLKLLGVSDALWDQLLGLS